MYPIQLSSVQFLHLKTCLIHPTAHPISIINLLIRLLIPFYNFRLSKIVAFQDKDPNNFSNQTRNDDVTRSRPTRHIIHPALQASPLRLPRGHLFSDPFLSRSVTYGRHLLPHALHGSRVSLPREVLYNEPASTQLTSDVKVCGGAQQRNPAKTVTLEVWKLFIIFCDDITILRN